MCVCVPQATYNLAVVAATISTDSNADSFEANCTAGNAECQRVANNNKFTRAKNYIENKVININDI